MNIFYRNLSFILSLGAIALLGGGLPAQAQTIKETTITETETTTYEGEKPKSESSAPKCENPSEPASQRIQLFYYRQATNLISILKAIPSLKCLVIASSSEDLIILNGEKDLIKEAYRVIASIDLPLPGIEMQMWGIQISSDDPKDLAKVMTQIREEINLTQQLIQDTFVVIKQHLRDERETNKNIPGCGQEETVYPQNISEPDCIFDPKLDKLLIKDMGYGAALSSNRPLSLIDVVLSGDGAQKPVEFNQKLHSKLMELMQKDKRYEKYLAAMKKKSRPPFDRFFRSRGLKPKRECKILKDPKKQEKCETWGEWEWTDAAENNPNTSEGAAETYVKISRKVILEFALQYVDSIANPTKFSPYQLQQTSNTLNDRLQDTTDALNKDIEDFFIKPTLDRIQEIVSDFGSVSYAQVGRTTIASLNGIPTTISSNSVSAFDVTPPPKLSELLTNAEKLSKQISPFIPTESLAGATGAPTELTVGGALPISRVIGLIAAFAEQEAKFRELQTGITLKFTPNVLRNMNSAELKIDLTIVDPEVAGTRDKEVPPLSRIGRQELSTRVYTQAVDFFALSTFSNQSTLDGGHTYFPIVGWIWKGIFGSIPGFGKLFSWPNPPKNVRHESLLLTNSYITPTSMGLALLYPIDKTDRYKDEQFCYREEEVKSYIAQEFKEPLEVDICDRIPIFPDY